MVNTTHIKQPVQFNSHLTLYIYIYILYMAEQVQALRVQVLEGGVLAASSSDSAHRGQELQDAAN